MTSLNQLIKRIKAIADAHTQINTFAVGQNYDYSANSALLYPCLWVIPDGASPDIPNRTIDYRFKLVMMDIEQSGGLNQVDILNDSALILTDVLAQLQQDSEVYPDWRLASAGAYDPFVDSHLDTVSGHTCDIVLQTFYAGDTCSEILEGYVPDENVIFTDNRNYIVWH